MFHYENFKKAMQRYSEELVQEVVYASWYGNTWLLLLIFIISFDFLRLFLIHYPTIYGILYIFFLFCFVFNRSFIYIYQGKTKDKSKFFNLLSNCYIDYPVKSYFCLVNS